MYSVRCTYATLQQRGHGLRNLGVVLTNVRMHAYVVWPPCPSWKLEEYRTQNMVVGRGAPMPCNPTKSTGGVHVVMPRVRVR